MELVKKMFADMYFNMITDYINVKARSVFDSTNALTTQLKKVISSNLLAATDDDDGMLMTIEEHMNKRTDLAIAVARQTVREKLEKINPIKENVIIPQSVEDDDVQRYRRALPGVQICKEPITHNGPLVRLIMD